MIRAGGGISALGCFAALIATLIVWQFPAADPPEWAWLAGPFESKALTFVIACGLGVLGGIGVLLGWRRLGGVALVAALGVTVSLGSHLVPRVMFPMIPVGLLGLVAFFGAPKKRAAASAAELQRVRAAVAALTAEGPLRFEVTGAFHTNLALGAVVVLPAILLWQRGQTYVTTLSAEGVQTRGGKLLTWDALSEVSKRTFRKRGWFIGHRLLTFEFTTGGEASLEETALSGPFEQVWSAL